MDEKILHWVVCPQCAERQWRTETEAVRCESCGSRYPVQNGVLNLLPVPLLDGGHLLYYFAEVLKGSPVSDRAFEVGQRIGMAVLAMLMALALFNDLSRLF